MRSVSAIECKEIKNCGVSWVLLELLLIISPFYFLIFNSQNFSLGFWEIL